MDSNLSLDIEELKRLLELSERPRVKKLLDQELESLLKAQKSAEDEKNKIKTVPLEIKKSTSPISYTTIDSYSWDQDYDKVKIYIFLEGAVQEKTFCNFTENSLELKIHGVYGKNLRFSLRLLKSIAAEKSSFVVRPKRITIVLKKKEGGLWSDVVKKEDKLKPPKLDSDRDPMAGIMDMMKNMYEEGDDEMKKTIAKAWTESKSGKMDLGKRFDV